MQIQPLFYALSIAIGREEQWPSSEFSVLK